MPLSSTAASRPIMSLSVSAHADEHARSIRGIASPVATVAPLAERDDRVARPLRRFVA